MVISCTCGNKIQVAPSIVGKAGVCPACKRIIHLVAGGTVSAGFDDDFHSRLVVESGPQLVGAQFFLGGGGPIQIGKLADRHIHLPCPDVSRNHCQLQRVDDVWRLEDQGSKNGTIVNGEIIANHDLQSGDFIRIADFELLYLCPVEPIIGEPTEQDRALEAARIAARNKPKQKPKGILQWLFGWLQD